MVVCRAQLWFVPDAENSTASRMLLTGRTAQASHAPSSAKVSPHYEDYRSARAIAQLRTTRNNRHLRNGIRHVGQRTLRTLGLPGRDWRSCT